MRHYSKQHAICSDGDMTLYADGKDFARDSELTYHLLDLLQHGKYVAIVTAAGYGSDYIAYEKRLSGLLSAMKDATHLTSDMKQRFLVMGQSLKYNSIATNAVSRRRMQFSVPIQRRHLPFGIFGRRLVPAGNDPEMVVG